MFQAKLARQKPLKSSKEALGAPLLT